MSVRLYTRIATIAAVAVAVGATASYASAGDSKGKRIEIPANLANLREPGSTGYVPKTRRSRFRGARGCPESTSASNRSRARPATSRRRTS